MYEFFVKICFYILQQLDLDISDLNEQSSGTIPGKPTDSQPATISSPSPSQNSTEQSEPQQDSTINQDVSRQQDQTVTAMHAGMFFQPGMGQWVMQPGGMVVWQPFNQPALQQAQAMYMQHDGGGAGQWQHMTGQSNDLQTDQSGGQLPMFYQQMAPKSDHQKPIDQSIGQPIPMFYQQISPQWTQGSSIDQQWGAAGVITQPHSASPNQPPSRPSSAKYSPSRPTDSEYPPLPPSAGTTEQPPLPDSTPPPAPTDSASPQKTKSRQLSGQSTSSPNEGQRQSSRHRRSSSSTTRMDNSGGSSSGRGKLRKQSSERSEDLEVKKEPSDYEDGISVQRSSRKKVGILKYLSCLPSHMSLCLLARWVCLKQHANVNITQSDNILTNKRTKFVSSLCVCCNDLQSIYASV